MAIELMLLGPAVALLSFAVSGVAGTPGPWWATGFVLLAYFVFRVTGELVRAR